MSDTVRFEQKEKFIFYKNKIKNCYNKTKYYLIKQKYIKII